MWSDETIVLSIINSLIVGFSSSLIGALVADPSRSCNRTGGRFIEGWVYPFLLSPFAVPWLVYGLALLFFWGLTGQRLVALDADPRSHRSCYSLCACASPLASAAQHAAQSGARRARFAVRLPFRPSHHVTLPYIRSGVTAGHFLRPCGVAHQHSLFRYF